MGDAAQAQEAEALEKMRQMLPDDGIARAWANVTFTDNQGRLNEIDILLLTRTGLFVVELKGWNGRITGDQREWVQGGRRHPNPRILANSKAKRLSSVLKDLARDVGVSANAVPFISEAVVLHGRNSVVQLDRFGAESVWALNGYGVQGLAPDRAFSVLLAQPAQRDPIDLPRAKAIDRLMDAAGLMPRPRRRMIGQYALDSGEPLGEGPGWQDYLVTHPRAKTKHRIRLYPYPKGASRDVRHSVDIRAEREFRLTFGIAHPGIIGPSEFLTPEEGPALVFAYDPDELSLDDYLTQQADELTFEDRESLLQELAELVRFAHGQRLTHRALSPLSVRVKSNTEGSVTLKIRDWDLARRPDEGTTSATEISRGLTDIRGSVEHDAFLYLAPETLRQATPASPQTLDVYGVGAVAIRILTGKPPALNLAALEELVGSDATGLDPRAQLPEISDEYAAAILGATTFDEQHRTIDISEFQRDIEDARRSGRPAEPESTQIDPLDAAVGDIVGGRFEILKRRGSGSTGVALEVTDYEFDHEGVILKLAKDDAAATRLDVEAEVLDRLDHPRIVKRLDGPLNVGARRGLLLTDAGTETLSDRIRIEGSATIEQLERYGADLFDLVGHLESRGVFHRDIKPSNLAVKPDPGSRKPRLTLFDFSLAEEPLTHIKSGSRPYLDPYLGAGGRSQYDSAAERFAIAATLFELATADPIWWEQGDAPRSATDAPVVQATVFAPAVADGLTSFFRTALAPKAEQRHASLDAMRAAWAVALSGAAIDAEDIEANDAKAAAALTTTALAESGLGARAISALSRLRVSTVGELLGVPPMSINQIRGLGEQVRREISTRVREWRHRLTATTAETTLSVDGGRRPVEDYIGKISAKPGESREERLQRVRKNGTLSGPTQDAARWLRELDNVATTDELARKLLREYGSTLTEERRMDAAAEIVRVILELDAQSRDPLFVYLRVRDRAEMVVAYAPADDSGLTFDEADLSIETLLRLGESVDRLLEEAAVVPAAALREVLFEGTPQLRLSDARLTQLAVGLSRVGRLSSMGEVYRTDLDPSRAVELALQSAATRELAVVTIEQRVRARFPEVEAIPDRPALDRSVRAAMPHLEWHEAAGKYAARADSESSRSYTAGSTTFDASFADPAIAARLRGSVRDSGALVIVTSRRQSLATTAARLAQEYGLTVVDLADVVLDALKSTAEAKRVKWPVVVEADSEPIGSRARRNLEQLARAAVVPVWEELLAAPEPIVFVNAAVLARVGLDDLIGTVMNLATPRAGARWFLLPRPLSGRTPDLDGVPMPFGADGWMELSLEGLPALAPSVVVSPMLATAAVFTPKGLTK